MADENDEVATHVEDTSAEAVVEPVIPQAPVEKAVVAEDEKDEAEESDHVADRPLPLQNGIVVE